MARLGTMPVRNSLDTVNDLEDSRKVLGRKAWKLTARIGWLKIVWGSLVTHVVSCSYIHFTDESKVSHDLAGQKPTSDGRVANNLDTELASRLEDSRLRVLNVERERRILDLQSRNRVHCMRTTKGLGRHLGEAEKLHLSCPKTSTREKSETRYRGLRSYAYLTCSAIAVTVTSMGTVRSALHDPQCQQFWMPCQAGHEVRSPVIIPEVDIVDPKPGQ